jgi:TonB family protein
VAAVISRRKGAIQSCYERELKKNPNIAGKVVVRFNIGTAGRVTSASVASSSLGAPAVGSCVVSRIKSWRFPKPEGGSVTVTKSFVFATAK